MRVSTSREASTSSQGNEEKVKWSGIVYIQIMTVQRVKMLNIRQKQQGPDMSQVVHPQSYTPTNPSNAAHLLHLHQHRQHRSRLSRRNQCLS